MGRGPAALAGFSLVPIVLSLLLPESFLTSGNVLNVSRQVAMLAVVAVSMTVVMAMGDFDLSVGSMASLAGVVAAVLFSQGFGVPLVILAALAVGTLGGLVNGLLVSYVGLLPFVATLATLTIYSGLAFIVSDGKTIFGRAIPDAFSAFARAGVDLSWIGAADIRLPALTILAVGVAALLAFLLQRLAIGRHLYVIGNNVEAAILAGIPVRRIRALAYVVTGAGAAIAGLMLVSRVASANPIQGTGLMLDSIACVFLGMTLYRDGQPRVGGTLIGVLTLGLIDNGLTQLSIDSYVRQVLVGMVLISAVALAGKRA